MNFKMGIKMKEQDWVDSDNHIIDRNNLKNHTDSYIRQCFASDGIGKIYITS